MVKPLRHLILPNPASELPYRSVISGGTPRPQFSRDRRQHSRTLLAQLAALQTQEAGLIGVRAAKRLPEDAGMTLAIEVQPKNALDVASIEWKRDGIELLNVSETEQSQVVTVHVPLGKLTAFEKRVKEYQEKDRKPRKDGSVHPAHEALVNAISNFRVAVFEELWTDLEPMPDEQTPIWYQVWLRTGTSDPRSTRTAFADRAAALELQVEPGFVSFPGRTVVAVFGTRARLQEAVQLLDLVAEIRSVKTLAGFFLGKLTQAEIPAWVNDLRGRLVHDRDTKSYVSLLDTGVARGHPLLVDLIDASDLHAFDPAWTTDDEEGHGTNMSGICLHGDLTPALSASTPHPVTHRLESVKILPDAGVNAPHLYGRIMTTAVRTVTHTAPHRDRTFAMMTTSVGETDGVPSEWSAQIDRLAFGLDAKAPSDGAPQPPIEPRLFVLAAGNVPWPAWDRYPAVNMLQNVENPGQSWNALTVGASTCLTQFDAATWPDLRAIGSAGTLSPASRTSMVWDSRWPFKPDVVAEGGNGCLDVGRGGVTVGPEDLRLLTTSHEPTRAMLAETGDTSAATATVARICAILRARYPTLWPESHRALVVHGARWTAPMLGSVTSRSSGADKRRILRSYGYGEADLQRSANSFASDATMVVQEHIVPYVQNGNGTRLGNLKLHELPWPVHELNALDDASVQMRVTLSYFIEPNPAQRGWQSKYRYQSHGLRFAVKGATEDETRFQQRINRIEREAAGPNTDTESMSDPDAEGWFLGAKLRGQGCLHSDVWTGTARSLASKSHVAVFPVGGWWKDWAGVGRENAKTRYALVVSLKVLSDLDVDIYTAIATKIGVPVAIEVA